MIPQSRSKLLATLVPPVAIAVLAATFGTYRIAVLSSDLGELLDRDVPVERAAEDLRRLAARRAEVLQAARAQGDREFELRIGALSGEISNQLVILDRLFAGARDGTPDPGGPRSILERVRSEEAASRSASRDGDASAAQPSRAVESAAADLAGLSRKITDRAAAQATADERTSLSLLAGRRQRPSRNPTTAGRRPLASTSPTSPRSSGRASAWMPRRAL